MGRRDREDRECDQAAHLELYEAQGHKPFAYRAIGGARRLWHGRHPLTDCDILDLQKEGITHILDLREPVEWQAPQRIGGAAISASQSRGITRCHVPIRDTEAPTPAAFTRACAFLQEALANPQARVYVHCRAGVERTGTILAAFRAWEEGGDFDTALTELQREGAAIYPLSNQKAAARAWLATERENPTLKKIL